MDFSSKIDPFRGNNIWLTFVYLHLSSSGTSFFQGIRMIAFVFESRICKIHMHIGPVIEFRYAYTPYKKQLQRSIACRGTHWSITSFSLQEFKRVDWKPKFKTKTSGNSANGNRKKNVRKNGNHSKTSGSRQRKLKYCQSKILLFINVFLKFYISSQILFGILLFSRQNMH